jgi:hypothetical protein
MEMLLPGHDVSNTTALGSTDANANSPTSAGSQPQDHTKDPQQSQQLHCQQQRNSD